MHGNPDNNDNDQYTIRVQRKFITNFSTGLQVSAITSRFVSFCLNGTFSTFILIQRKSLGKQRKSI